MKEYKVRVEMGLCNIELDFETEENAISMLKQIAKCREQKELVFYYNNSVVFLDKILLITIYKYNKELCIYELYKI